MCPVQDRKRRLIDNGEVEDDAQAQLAEIVKLSDLAAFDTGKSSDPFVNALGEIHASTRRAIKLVKEKLLVIDEKYLAGCETGLDPQILDITPMLKAATAELHSLADEVGLKVHKSISYKLPAEVFLEIFAYLDMDSLISCQATCLRWKNLLKADTAQKEIWQDTPINLHGTVTEIEAKWLTYKMVCPEPSSMSIIVAGKGSKKEYEHYQDLTAMLVRAELPVKTLQSFKFNSVDYCVQELMWKRVVQCRRLKILHWKYEGKSSEDLGLSHQGETLARLEELKVDVASEGFMGESKSMLRTLCCRLKRFHHMQGMERDCLMVILRAAEAYLEDLLVVKIAYRPRYDYFGYLIQDDIRPFSMYNLKRVCIQDTNVGILDITAPNATSVRFDHGDLVDWSLIDSCRRRLRKLHIMTKGITTQGRLGQETFAMPMLEDLHLDFQRGADIRWPQSPEGGVLCYEDYSIAAFWQLVCSGDIKSYQGILPRLKKLRIIHDPMLDAALFLKYLVMRKLLGQPALQKVDLFLANHRSEDNGALQALRRMRSILYCQQFDQWKSKGRREWLLTDELTISSGTIYSGDIDDWMMHDSCRNLLKKLDISIYHEKTYQRFKDDLFNMPCLEHLSLYFCGSRYQEGEGKWSATALWKALSTGITGNDEIMVQDILPRITTLKVVNDATLDQDKIVSMVEIRKSLGLDPITSMIIHLPDGSYECDKLDKLKETQPGLYYKVYDGYN